jgi:hypothetical protein
MMKKLVLLLMVLMGSFTAQAADTYPYLTLETTDGSKLSVSTSALTITVSGSTLTIGSEQFTVSNLKKMYFSATDDTTAGIEKTVSAALSEAVAIYDLQGHKVSKAQMRKGAYIIQTKQGTSKIVIK